MSNIITDVNITNVDITNIDILNHLNNYSDFYDCTIINYLSENFKIHKERISIKKINYIEFSNNAINIENKEYFILINDSSYNIFLKILDQDISNQDISNNEYLCKINNNLILNNINKLEFLYDKNNNNIFDNVSIKYLIFEDECKTNIIKNNPEQLLENYSIINEKKTIFLF